LGLEHQARGIDVRDGQREKLRPTVSDDGQQVARLLSFVIRQRASVTSTEAGFPKGDLGWRSSV